MHRVKGIDFLMEMLSPARLLTPRGSKIFCPGKLQVCKVLGGDPLHLLISVETYIAYGFQGDEGPDPLPSFGSAHASSLKLS